MGRVGGKCYQEPIISQILAEEFSKAAIIIYDQNMCGTFHSLLLHKNFNFPTDSGVWTFKAR